MTYFLADISLPAILTEEFNALIPEQRSFVDTLMLEGRILNYSLSLDWTKLWMVFAADSHREIDSIIELFPIASFITYTVHPLAFHNSSTLLLHRLSLN
jgi:muconolactone delta-isomerase